MKDTLRATAVADHAQDPGDGRARATTPLRVVVVDDSDDLRALVRLAFAADRRFEIVGQGADGTEAVDLSARLRPDILLLDLAMPGVDGLSALPEIRRAAPRTRVMVLSGFQSPEMAQRAIERGADAYVEKGTPLSRLLELAWQVGRPVEGDREDTPVVGAADDPEPETDALDSHELHYPLRVEAAMRMARWFAVVFVLLQFLLYEAPDGLALPFDRFVAAVGGALAIVGLNALSSAVSRSGDVRRVRRAGVGILAGDTAVVLGMVWLFSFDHTSALWALLVIPVLEGAMRGRLRGALATWAVTAVVYVARDAWASGHYDRPFEAASVHYRLGIILLVAVASGHLAHNLHFQVVARDRVARESRRRAELLRIVADATRAMASVDVEKVHLAVLEGACRLGVDSAQICTYDEAAGTWQVQFAGGDEEPDRRSRPITAGIAGRVHDTHAAHVVERAADGRTVAALPVEAGGVTVAALVVWTVDEHAVGRVELECLSLLTAQAGLAIRNAQFLEDVRGRASHDALTGLPNQVLFEDRCSLAMAQADRTGTGVALLFVDLDRFKRVNDEFGHETGNALLREVADRLGGALRAGDTVARIGGDEFALALAGLDDQDDAPTIAEKLLSLFDRPFVLDGREVAISASIGIACYPDDAADYGALLRAADLAMYEVKSRGRNGYHRSRSPRIDRTPSEARLESDLRQAVRNGTLAVWYQPVYSLRSGTTVGVEALARWDHPVLGDIPPSRFVALAERIGIVEAVDAHVIGVACEQVAAWNRRRAEPLRLAVNVSGQHIENGDVAAVVLRALSRSGLDPGLLTIELTETAATEQVEAIRRALAALKDLHVELAIDDFGTGYAMLTRVQQYPVDTLKIDRSFVGSGVDSEANRLLDATIELGHRLELNVVVEGVETREQARLLEMHGCDLVQGFYFGRPLPADEATRALVPG